MELAMNIANGALGLGALCFFFGLFIVGMNDGDDLATAIIFGGGTVVGILGGITTFYLWAWQNLSHVHLVGYSVLSVLVLSLLISFLYTRSTARSEITKLQEKLAQKTSEADFAVMMLDREREALSFERMRASEIRLAQLTRHL